MTFAERQKKAPKPKVDLGARDHSSTAKRWSFQFYCLFTLVDHYQSFCDSVVALSHYRNEIDAAFIVQNIQRQSGIW